MAQPASDALSAIFLDHRDEVLEDWIASQQSAVTLRHDLLSKAELRRESQDFLDAAAAAAQDGSIDDVDARGWERGRDYLASLSRSRAIGGFSPSETATFVLSLKRPVFDRLEALSGGDATALRESMWRATALIDRLALLTTDAYLRSREEIINRQQQELLELSTPVVKLWEGVLAVPMIGTLDSARTQVVMENLLQRIVETGAPLAIIDITGVPTVDTLVAQHLLKTVAAARLMGADCIISGIRPQIAQTIVHLGVDLGDVVDQGDAWPTRSRLALQRSGVSVVKAAPGSLIDDGAHPDPQAWATACSSPSRWTCTTSWRWRSRTTSTKPDRRDRRARRPDRHLGAGDRRLVHRPDAGQHRRDGAGPRREDRRRRHAAGGGDHAGRARALAARRPDRPERRVRAWRCCRRWRRGERP